MNIDDFGTLIAIITIILLSYLVSRSIGDYVFSRKLANDSKTREVVGISKINEKLESNPCGFAKEKDERHLKQIKNLPRRSSPRFIEEVDDIVNKLSGTPDLLVQKIVDLCNKNYDAASAIFFKARSMGVISNMDVSRDFFFALCSSCIRVGSPHFIFKYLDEMDEMNVSRDLDFYNLIVKTLTFKKFHKISLSLSDQYLKIGLNYSDVETMKSIFSSLLYSAAESKEYWRSAKFFKQIVRTGLIPSDRDYQYHVRSIIHREDWKTGLVFLSTMPPNIATRPLLHAIFATKNDSIFRDLIAGISHVDIVNVVLNIGVSKEMSTLIFDRIGSNEDLMNNETIEILLNQINFIDGESLVKCLSAVAPSGSLPANAIALVNILIERGIGFPVEAIFRLKPNLKTFTLLFASPADPLVVYNSLHSSELEGLTIDFFNTVCLPAMPDGDAVKKIVDELDKFGVVPNNETFQLLVKRVLHEFMFDVCWQLIVTDMVGRFGIVPTIPLYLTVIEAAIARKQYTYVNLFMQGMCDQHTLCLSWNSDCERISASDVERLLQIALNTEEEAFFLILELVLLNKLSLNHAQFTDMITKIYNKDRLRTILNKYKYKVPIKKLQH